jgi:hypothetical protein
MSRAYVLCDVATYNKVEMLCWMVGISFLFDSLHNKTTFTKLTKPARNAPPYCHLQPLWLHLILRHYLINGKIFEKTLLNII